MIFIYLHICSFAAWATAGYPTASAVLAMCQNILTYCWGHSSKQESYSHTDIYSRNGLDAVERQLERNVSVTCTCVLSGRLQPLR